MSAISAASSLSVRFGVLELVQRFLQARNELPRREVFLVRHVCRANLLAAAAGNAGIEIQALLPGEFVGFLNADLEFASLIGAFHQLFDIGRAGVRLAV